MKPRTGVVVEIDRARLLKVARELVVRADAYAATDPSDDLAARQDLAYRILLFSRATSAMPSEDRFVAAKLEIVSAFLGARRNDPRALADAIDALRALLATETTAPLVLVVDDNDDLREMIAEVIAHAGYPVITGRDGAEAVALARGRHPDLVLMDIAMPGIDGVEATRRLKQDPETKGIAIVGITGQGPQAAEEMRRAGAVDVFLKPCLPAEILACVAKVRRA